MVDQEELKNLVYSGFKITIAQNNFISEQQNQLNEKQNQFDEKPKEFAEKQNEFSELQRSYSCTIQELQDQLSELRRVQTERKEKQLRFARRIRRKENQPIQLEHYLFALGVVGEKPTFSKTLNRTF